MSDFDQRTNFPIDPVEAHVLVQSVARSADAAAPRPAPAPVPFSAPAVGAHLAVDLAVADR